MFEKNYINYHCHSMYSNVSTPDCTITNKQRGTRSVELGMGVVSGVEHGWTGRFIEVYEFAKKNNVKPLFGSEVYFVKNRLEKDKTNSHVIILAKNESGRKELNKILSEANISGYYYKARIDNELLLSLNPKNFWVTTSCLGGIWKYEDHENIIQLWKEHFGKNLFLEVQPHHTEEQRELNRKVLGLAKKLKLNLIAGMDSHMIFPEQAKERDDYLLSRGIEYPEEQGWFLDFPSYDEAVERFVQQGVMGKKSIEESLYNTNILNEVEEYNSNIFNNSNIKLPTIHPEKTQEERNNILLDIILKEWSYEKMNVPQDKHSLYEKEIQKEFDVIKETGMADYFILDYEIVKRGKEKGGSITLTGRGSAPSFYITKLLGLTTVDRIGASVKLFPERFVSKERLLETKSLPDIDLNLGTPEVFADAQAEIIGEGHSYKMLAFGTVKTLGAWKLYARVSGIDFETSNSVSDKLKLYEDAIKHAHDEEEKESIKPEDYIGNEYASLFMEAKKYVGLVNTLTPHPCAYIIYSDGDIREEFGLVKIKTGSVEHICANIDGEFAEKYKFLKNDLLKVSVVDSIYRTYNRIGITPHTLPELLQLCDGDKDVWGVYENALGIGINQVEQPGTIYRVAKYKPKNISELSAFIAAIRPGFKSNYKQFEDRESFSYGVKTIDELIQTKEFPQSYMLYQENAMQVMAYAGIPISETYDIIKNIAKKRVEKVLGYKTMFVENMEKSLCEKDSMSKEKASEVAKEIWQIIEDSSLYSFNASHSYSVAGDSLYGAYLKSKYPLFFYETILRMYEEDGDKEKIQKAKEEASSYFGIKFPAYRLGQDNRSIVADEKSNSISSSLASIKGFGKDIGDKLYELGLIEFASFVDLLIYCEENAIVSSKFETLIKVNYFEKHGKNKKLLSIWNEFKNGKNKYGKKLSEKSKNSRKDFLKNLEAETLDEKLSFIEQAKIDMEVFGKFNSTYPSADKRLVIVESLEKKYPSKLSTTRSIKNGKEIEFKIQKKIFERKEFSEGDVLLCTMFEKKKPVKLVDGKFVEIDGDPVWWLQEYKVIKNVEECIC